MKKIYIDLDDVIADTATEVRGILHSIFGIKVSYENMINHNMGEGIGLSQNDYMIFFDALHEKNNLLAIDCLPGCKDILNKLKQQYKFEICIVTGRPDKTMQTTKRWLSQKKIPYDNLFFVDKYRRFKKNINEELHKISNYGFNLVIEDSPEMALFFSEKCKTPVFLMEQPWNINVKESEFLKRVCHWNELEKLIVNMF